MKKCNTIKLCPDQLGRFEPNARKPLDADSDSLELIKRCNVRVVQSLPGILGQAETSNGSVVALIHVKHARHLMVCESFVGR